jgi:hypothetical protein
MNRALAAQELGHLDAAAPLRHAEERLYLGRVRGLPESPIEHLKLLRKKRQREARVVAREGGKHVGEHAPHLRLARGARQMVC